MNVQSLKDKIRNASNDLNLPFNEIWQRVILERFLVRLAKSNESQYFILKGGSLLARYIDIGRETKDLDFLLTKVKSEKIKIAKSIEAIIGSSIADGFLFSLSSVEDLVHTHMKYPGFSVHLTCLFGNMKGQLDLDIGTGDAVDPVEKNLDLLTASGKPIFENIISVLVYPPETIFAEKLHTALVRGAANSRMKDYHDMLSLISSEGILNKAMLKNAIKNTFANRGALVEDLPLKFSEKGFEELQKYWDSYIERRASAKNLPPKIEQVISQINEWITAVL